MPDWRPTYLIGDQHTQYLIGDLLETKSPDLRPIRDQYA